jgi:hypothetical protein
MMIAETATPGRSSRHITEPARSALTREERGRAARLATKAEVSGEHDLAAGLRNLARTAPRARGGVNLHIP